MGTQVENPIVFQNGTMMRPFVVGPHEFRLLKLENRLSVSVWLPLFVDKDWLFGILRITEKISQMYLFSVVEGDVSLPKTFHLTSLFYSMYLLGLLLVICNLFIRIEEKKKTYSYKKI